MRNVSDKSLDKIKTHILYSVIFIRKSAVYWIMQRKIIEPGRPRMTVWRMLI